MTDTKPALESLLPCPLCGPGDTGVYSEAAICSGIVRCSACNLVMCCNTEAEAIAAWNRRAEPDAQADERPITRDPAPTLEQRREIAEAWKRLQRSPLSAGPHERLTAALRAAGLLGDEQ